MLFPNLILLLFEERRKEKGKEGNRDRLLPL